MKKFIFSILVVVAVLMIVGTAGNNYLHCKHGYINCQKKLANKDSIISELKESIFLLNYRAEYLQITMDYIRTIDSSKVEEAERILWNNIKEE